MPQKPPRDPKLKSRTQGDAERALHVDDMALRALSALMSGEDEFPMQAFPPSPENTDLNFRLQMANFLKQAPPQELFNMLRANKDFAGQAKQDRTPNQFVMTPQEKK